MGEGLQPGGAPAGPDQNDRRYDREQYGAGCERQKADFVLSKAAMGIERQVLQGRRGLFRRTGC
jgi:hypothetical protein